MLQGKERVFAIGDIHGCCRTFSQLLSKLRLEATDTVFLLGDYIDRGPDSKGVLETILHLQRDGYDVRPIRGNHEQMLLDALSNSGSYLWLGNGGLATLMSYGAGRPGDLPHDHIAFLRALPHCLCTDTHVFVHAGLDFSRDDPLTQTNVDFMLWSRMGWAVEPEKIGGRKVVVGHTVRDLDEIVESLEHDLISLDNGCFMGGLFEGRGNLVGLELKSGELFVQKNVDI